MTTTTDEFARALTQVRSAGIRPEFRLDEAPAPQRLAPFAVALTAETVSDDDAASGRFVLLHDPDGVDEWDGTFRAVVFVRAALEPDLVADPMLNDVGWSWVLEALEGAHASATQVGGTVTATSGRSFGSMSDRPSEGFIEIRGSWTPVAEGSPADEMDRHVRAWMELLAHAAGLAPLPVGVAHVGSARRRSPR